MSLSNLVHMTIGDIHSIRIIEDWNWAEWKQRSFPRSKKKRIRKKWARNFQKYWDYLARQDFVRLNHNTYMCHPASAEELREAFGVNSVSGDFNYRS